MSNLYVKISAEVPTLSTWIAGLCVIESLTKSSIQA